jgi:N-acetyl-anhydromuramyl-L-alanine amidase AmpD
MEILFKPVTNFSYGRAGFNPEAIVIHIAEGTLQGGYAWFNNPTSQASSHYMVGKRGEIWQFVKDENTAWHAGGINKPSWNLLKPGVNPNLYTIGIENEGFTGEPWTENMYRSCAELIFNLSVKYSIPVDRDHIIGHYQINSVSRINCPGNGVDLNKLINLVKNYSEDPEMIAELQAQIKKLAKQIDNLSKANIDASTIINKYKAQNTLLVRDTNRLKKEIQELKDAANNSDIESLQRENTLLRNEIATLQANQIKLNNRIIELEKLVNN